MVRKGQVTLDVLENVQQIKGLTPNERKVINLIGLGFFPADVARKMKVSAPYINTLLKKLLSKGLIQRMNPVARQDGRREYHHFYQVSPQLKSMVKEKEQYTACRVHNLRKKIHIISQSKELSLDKRAGYESSWKMRGPLRHKFWYPGKAGMPSVTVDYHIKSLIVYVDKKQKIVARTPQGAMEIGWRAIYAAVDKFVESQSRFGVGIELSHVGETVGKPEGGFVFTDRPGTIGERAMQEGVTNPKWHIDRSVEPEMGPHKPELETNDEYEMTMFDKLIKVSQQTDFEKLPEAMREINEKLNPLSASVLQVQAILQGGITISQQYEQMLNFMTKVLDEMAQMRKENAELKQKLGVK